MGRVETCAWHGYGCRAIAGTMIALALVMRGAALWGQPAFDEMRPHLVRQAQEVLDRELGTRMSAWTAEVMESVVGSAGPLPTDTVAYALAVGAHREAITAMMRERLQSAMPELMRTVFRQWTPRSRSGAVADASAVDRAAEALLERAMAPQLDGLAAQWSEATVNRLLACVGQMGPMERQMCPFDVAIDPTNLRGTIDQIVQPQLLVNLVKRPLAEAIGQSTVDAIQDRLSTALKGELPKELNDYLMTGINHFKADARTLEQYLPGVQWDKWKDKLLGKTAIHLPNTVYGAMLAGSAARHFSKVICGPGCFNTYELERGLEVLQFLTWQFTHREGIAISVGQLVGFLGQAGQELHIPDPSQWGKLGDALGKGKEKLQWFEDNLHKLDARYKQGVQTATAHMEQIVREFEGKLLELQATLLTPVQQAIDMTNEGFGVIRGKLHAVVKPWDRMMQKVKDYFARLEGKDKWDVTPFAKSNPECGEGSQRQLRLMNPYGVPQDFTAGQMQRIWPTDYCKITAPFYEGWRGGQLPAGSSYLSEEQKKLVAKIRRYEQKEKNKAPIDVNDWPNGVDKKPVIMTNQRLVSSTALKTPNGMNVTLQGYAIEVDDTGQPTKIYGKAIYGEKDERELAVEGREFHRHDGLDIRAPLSSDIRAVEAGTLIQYRTNNGIAHEVIIQTSDQRYLHYVHMGLDPTLARQLNKNGEGALPIAAGQIIGKSDASGTPNAAHLHLRVCTGNGVADCYDPRQYLPTDCHAQLVERNIAKLDEELKKEDLSDKMRADLTKQRERARQELKRIKHNTSTAQSAPGQSCSGAGHLDPQDAPPPALVPRNAAADTRSGAAAVSQGVAPITTGRHVERPPWLRRDHERIVAGGSVRSADAIPEGEQTILQSDPITLEDHRRNPQ